MRRLVIWLCVAVGATAFAHELPPLRPSTVEEQRLDAAAFESLDERLTTSMTDVQSVVVILQGRTVYEYFRDGKPDALRDTQSVTKSALALLVGTALQRGHLKSLEQPVVELIPEWRALNPDPRSHAITVRHLLAMTTGFEVNDGAGTLVPLAPTEAWARPIQAGPGQRFAYDNSGPRIVQAVLEKVAGHSIVDLLRDQLVTPLALAEPRFARNLAWMRTADMATLGYLMLRDGRWAGQQLLPTGFVTQMITPQSSGGPPVRLPYGLGWWVPSGSTYFASGYGGQTIWVHPPLGLVVAVNSTVSPESNHRGQASSLIRGSIFQAAQRRLSAQVK